MLTYGEILAAADRGACELLQAKLKVSEPVVVPVSNLASDIAAFLAVWRAGGVVVPVHRGLPKTPFDALTTRLIELLWCLASGSPQGYAFVMTGGGSR